MIRNASIFLLSFLSLVEVNAQERQLNYGKDIRPILAENCFYCHGQDANQRKADVRLDTLKGQQEVLKAGKPDDSELIRRIFAADATELMPPPKSNRHLSPEQKTILKRWVAEGAKFEDHWAYRPIERPAMPVAATTSNNPIDRFIQARLTEKGLKPSPIADRRVLIRRVTFDLIGLPPTPEEVEAFVQDQSPGAFEKVLDRLFSSPHYGERMALPWLDAARYADSNGFQQDGDTFQWIWRDWVVKSLNENKPFDQFSIEQLAGDLLPNATNEQKIATAFNRNHLVNGEGGAIPEEQRFNILFDRIDVTATNWLGLTMACSQCHDHKYDPLTMKDYYSMMAAFNNLSESGTAGFQSSVKRVSPPFLELRDPSIDTRIKEFESVVNQRNQARNLAQQTWEKTVAQDVNFADKAIRELIINQDPKTKADRESKIRKHFDEKVEPKLAQELKSAQDAVNQFRANEIPKVMVMAEDRPRETHILDRGEYLKKKDKVTFDVPAFLPPLPKDAPKNRLGLARWLMSPENPLTARVAVNRMWQTFFGLGLIKTSEDLGVQSEVPIHQELLDWLAAEFRSNGWNMKAINRLIVSSATYQQSSKLTPEHLKVDPENRYYARGARFRLPSMMLRDAALATSGTLNRDVGGKPVYPYQPEGIWDTLAITKERDFTYPKSHGNDLYRRSIYTFWRRTVGPANMFDASSRQSCKVRPNVTNTPLHALTTLNDATWTEAARALSEKVILEAKTTSERMSNIYRRVLGRDPKATELPVLDQLLQQQAWFYLQSKPSAIQFLSVGESKRNESLDPVEHATWTAFCLAIFNLDETLTRE
jgi:hypothetical protein